ncbi:hypothetical protein CONPUDRAFT_140097 [Coniophora puteana RWD-64-598 SS2]|uniref:Uncharacterized protein n=1 Tax=Coniophora puteana (strain RWD-64-598) TaxID=741705 RepID=A0A5M3M753_CONPW|nr:uncharacterized protein CONPUDRAFT_140097 [Coniophora puteana RWD-64-598 SS2]EIW75079.1 hypothetical protein CONPUDRAFT_140097 [Coniophora puteana RWD-64-598 SS2]
MVDATIFWGSMRIDFAEALVPGTSLPVVLSQKRQPSTACPRGVAHQRAGLDAFAYSRPRPLSFSQRGHHGITHGAAIS